MEPAYVRQGEGEQQPSGARRPKATGGLTAGEVYGLEPGRTSSPHVRTTPNRGAGEVGAEDGGIRLVARRIDTLSFNGLSDLCRASKTVPRPLEATVTSHKV